MASSSTNSGIPNCSSNRSLTGTTQYSSDILQSTKVTYFKLHRSLGKSDRYCKVFNTCQQLIEKKGVHSTIYMKSAGFRYTNNEDTVRCDTCGLEVSGWTSDMKPFTIHAQRSPTCPFVLSLLPNERTTVASTISFTQSTSTLNDGEIPSKRQKIEVTQRNCQPYKFSEVKTLKQIRKRTFSHWPHRTSPSSAQMIEAGFFNCNVRDRVICLYCNIVCQQWTPHSDDPWEVHRTLSPKCPYVIAMLKHQGSSSLTNTDIPLWHQAAHNKAYVTPKSRDASFATWPTGNSPPIDELVRAGFFYRGVENIVTCFYCNGSLQNWGVNDNPTTEHARWFPHCAYAKQLCSTELYQQIQEMKRHREERDIYHELHTRLETNDNNPNSESVQPSVKDGCSRLIDARLDLPISRSLFDQNFSLSIIRRCWEDQLLSKHDDFTSDSELLVACMILKNQIELGVEEGTNIIIPSEHMRKLREKEGTGPVPQDQIDNLIPSNPCVVCLTEEKRLACIPCGHLVTCVPCGHNLRSCPICRREIDAFVGIYI